MPATGIQSEPGDPVSQDNAGTFSCNNRIDQLQKLLALKGETAS